MGMPSLLAALAATALAVSTACAAERMPVSAGAGLRRQLRAEETSVDSKGSVCGATGEACCAGDAPCRNKTTACMGATSDSAGVCEVCGATGEVCCPGVTACRVENTVCIGATSESDGVCEVCGAAGEVCCAGEKPCRGSTIMCMGASNASAGTCEVEAGGRTCSDDEAIAVVAANPELEAIARLAVAADVAEALVSDGGGFTLFAPVPEAFAAIAGDDYVETLGEDAAFLATIVNGHVIEGLFAAEDLFDGQAFTTLIGTELTVEINKEGITTIVGPDDVGTVAAITKADITSECGNVLHIVDKVFLTTEQTDVVNVDGTTLACGAEEVLAVFAANPELNAIGLAAIAANLDEMFVAPGNALTLFAPSPEAFVAIAGDDYIETLGEDPDLLASIVNGHVIDGSFKAEDLFDGQTFTTRLGTELTVAISKEGTATIVGPDNVGTVAAVTTKGIMACGNMVYVVDKVLLTTEQANVVNELEGGEIPCGQQLMNLLTDNSKLSTFGTVAGPGDIDGTTADAGPPVTIFAPTNAAFEAIAGSDAAAVLSADPDLITKILAGHLVDGFFAMADLTDGLVLTTAAGTELTAFVSSNGDVLLEGPDDVRIVATIAKADIVVCTSIVHIVDAVFLTGDQKASLAGP